MRSSEGYMSKEIGAYIKSGAIYKSVKRVRELMKCELCFNELSPNRPLSTTDNISFKMTVSLSTAAQMAYTFHIIGYF